MRVVEGVALTHHADYPAAREILRTVLSDLDDADMLTRWATQRFLNVAVTTPWPGRTISGCSRASRISTSLAQRSALSTT